MNALLSLLAWLLFPLPPVAKVVIRQQVLPRDTTGHLDLQMGQQRIVQADALDSLGQPIPQRTISWSSGDTTIVRIERLTGLVTAKNRGWATITAKSGGKQASLTVCVSEHNREELRTTEASRKVVPGAAQVIAGRSTIQEYAVIQLKPVGFLPRCVHWTVGVPYASITKTGLLTTTQSIPVGQVAAWIGPSIP